MAAYTIMSMPASLRAFFLHLPLQKQMQSPTGISTFQRPRHAKRQSHPRRPPPTTHIHRWTLPRATASTTTSAPPCSAPLPPLPAPRTKTLIPFLEFHWLGRSFYGDQRRKRLEARPQDGRCPRRYLNKTANRRFDFERQIICKLRQSVFTISTTSVTSQTEKAKSVQISGLSYKLLSLLISGTIYRPLPLAVALSKPLISKKHLNKVHCTQ